MSEVEALLSVDAGRVPPGTVVFFARDPERPTRVFYAILAVALAGMAVVAGLAGAHREPVALLVLMAGSLAVSATPTHSDTEEPPCKPPTLVVTPTGMIVRDDGGLRTWRFEELVEVRACLHQQRAGLVIVRRDGSQDFVDSLLFERGEHLREIIGRRLEPRQT